MLIRNEPTSVPWLRAMYLLSVDVAERLVRCMSWEGVSILRRAITVTNMGYLERRRYSEPPS
jgi:hypothetical protein